MSFEENSVLHRSSEMPVAKVDPLTGYFSNIDDIRREEYPMLSETTYLDHTGTTLYAKSLVVEISRDLTTNLFGNPHSGSTSSQLSSRRIDDTRVRVLRFLNADPDLFDVVFVANATAAIKLAAEALRDHAGGFFYSYHVDSHTSLVGVREMARYGNQCLDDNGVDEWLSERRELLNPQMPCTLLGYPGQSNFSGYRPPLDWCSRTYELRKIFGQEIYSLYDAAALLSTASMDFSNPACAPDFTALSFYKIFGLPDLGALLVRKECGNVLQDRKFFGGGTVDMITSVGDQWHASKQYSLHSRLEDGTVPFHNIIALAPALSIHSRLFGPMDNISRHTSFLTQRVHSKLSSLVHSTGVRVCEIYEPPAKDYIKCQGPTIAFNLRDAEGNWVGKSEVDRLASVWNIQLRTGGLCNPGGVATHLDLSAPELRNNFAAGQKCGDGNDILNCKPTGVVRVSFGAMSNVADADKLLDFVEEFFVQGSHVPPSPPTTPPAIPTVSSFLVQSLCVFPIKSCAAFRIPQGLSWEVRDEGLAWDREWCLIHQGTGVALNQKTCSRMAMICPSIDLERRVLRVQHNIDGCDPSSLDISLDFESGKESSVQPSSASICRSATVCGERQQVEVFTSEKIAGFFTVALKIPCTLARRPRRAATSDIVLTEATQSMSAHSLKSTENRPSKRALLANDSPILLVSQCSVDHLNSIIRSNSTDAKPVPADSFRGNIVIVQQQQPPPPLPPPSQPSEMNAPYAEDHWTSIQIGEDASNQFAVIGLCHRCQMVCVDQQSAEKRREPLSTLAKTRRRDGKVWFGIHLSPVMEKENRKAADKRFVKVGDVVKPQMLEGEYKDKGREV